MTTQATDAITPQAAGAFGEKAVEAELLRRKWIPANVNPTVKNAAKWRLSFGPRKDSQKEAGTDIKRKWQEYLGRWDLLDG
jgi:hypothetical protein